ncbi:transient receptor potential cation channel protein painless [Culex quinquefasciatus]|uniref:Transient receptor potential cation channel protein painless n=1 Tax=Culex quinquefasciatus TaxID=7176 RepID=B0WE81_CULQU|nr:transient receptor potential cation channel protein painless [Culex quinquefasciatus]|eukprot:XP_001847015.1 transient receptor potential cation channel protein painless [Culex quinquefasciatus]
MCRTERSSEFLRIFLEQIPIVNRELEKYTVAPPQSTPQLLEAPKRQSERAKTEKEPNRAIHIAIKARAFENVRTLLNIPGVNVDAIWKFKNYTPLMMLISVVESDNFSKVKKLVKHLADLKASINIGDFRMHPLSSICKLETVDQDEKMELLTFCLANFDCDVDGFFDGQARKDIEALGCKLAIEQKSAKVTFELLQSLILDKNTAEFVKRLEDFDSSDHEDKVLILLEKTATKGLDVCVEKIFHYLKDSEILSNNTENLFRILKEVCQNGFARVLKLFLANIKSKIECKHPLLLTSLRELRKSRTQVRLDCFKQLLNDRRIMAYVRDDQNQTALHYHGMDQEAKEILLKKTPYLWHLNNHGESPLHAMKADILEAFLDSKIFIPQESKEIQLSLNEFKLPRGHTYSEIAPFYFIAESKELKPLLRHPVIILYILKKWSEHNCANIRKIHIFRGLSKLRETVMIFLAGYSLLSTNNAVLSVLILLAGIDVIVHLRLFPYASLTTSIVMLETVSRSFLKILLIYLIIIISFGCSFFVLFSNYASQDQLEDSTQNFTTKDDFNNFSTLQGSLVKSLVMMIGELDASEIEFNGHKLSYIMFICFVFFVTLVVANLINGVAVSDITEIRQQAQVAALVSRVEMLRRFEKCLSFSMFSKWRTSSLFFTRYEPKITIKTNSDNQIVLTRKKVRPAPSEEPQQLKKPERKFDVMGRYGYFYNGVDEDTVNDAKNITIRNNNELRTLEEVYGQLKRVEDRIEKLEKKMPRFSKGDGGHGTNRSQQSQQNDQYYVRDEDVLQVQNSDLFGPLRDELLMSPQKVGFYTSTRFLRFPVRVDSGSGPVLGEGYRRMLGKTSSATITDGCFWTWSVTPCRRLQRVVRKDQQRDLASPQSSTTRQIFPVNWKQQADERRVKHFKANLGDPGASRWRTNVTIKKLIVRQIVANFIRLRVARGPPNQTLADRQSGLAVRQRTAGGLPSQLVPEGWFGLYRCGCGASLLVLPHALAHESSANARFDVSNPYTVRQRSFLHMNEQPNITQCHVLEWRQQMRQRLQKLPEQIAKTAPRGGKGVNDDDGPTRDDGRHEICYTMISSFARLQQSVRPVLDDALREGVLKQPGAGNRLERTGWTAEPGQEEEDKLQLLFLCSSGMGEEKATREKEQTRSSTTSQQNNGSLTEYYTDSSRKNDGEYLEVLG